ncbi:MAG: hypothetical protein AAFQ00_00910 [Pseudomonadota bacterium]
MSERAKSQTSRLNTSLIILTVLAVCAAIAVAITKGPTRVIEIAATYLGLLLVLSPKILCGFFIAASIPLLIPREVFVRWLGEHSGHRGLLMACLLGALVPGGPMMIFPLAISFRAAGASTATLITFVTAWSLLSVNRTVIWEMSFLPWDYVALRVLVCLPFPFLVGLAAKRVLN